MTRLTFASFTLSTLLLLATSSHALTPMHHWSQSFGSTGTDFGYCVAVDGLQNVFITGIFSGTVNFGAGALTSAGDTDIFLAKYNASGVHQWSKRMGSTSGDVGNSVAVDKLGNVVVTGWFYGSVDFGGGLLTSAGNSDIFVAKYDANGGHLWSKRFGNTNSDIGLSVALDGSANVLLTGYFTDWVNFGGVALYNAGGIDIFLAKYNASGTHLWSQRFGDTSSDRGYWVAADVSGNVLLTGSFSGTVGFGGGNLVSAGGTDIFVAKYNGSGTHQWSKRFGSTGADEGYSVAADEAEDVVVTGSFGGTVNFGGGNLVSAGGTDAFVAEYEWNGAHLWSRRFGSGSDDDGYSVATDSRGNVFVTGTFWGTVDFGGGALVSAGAFDIFVAKYNVFGLHLWSTRFGGVDSEAFYALAVDGSENVLVTGYFYGTVAFSSGSLMSAGGGDIVVAKYGSLPAEPVITSIADVGNDQGREVKVLFSRSGYDHLTASLPIVAYEVYRRDDAPPATTLAQHGQPGVSNRDLLAEGWLFVGSAPAHDESSYGIVAPTIGDSTETLGQYYSVFFVRAASAVPGFFFDSPTDSGYSVDNLSPGIPGGLMNDTITNMLAWNRSPALDFDYFTVYGSDTEYFEDASLIDYTVDTSMDVSGSGYSYAFVTATDFSGNESNPAWIELPTGVGGTPKTYVLSVRNFPNPFNPSTTVSYTVPSRGNVTVAIYDARGARVATLVNGETRDAGAYRAEWNGRTDAGAGVSSGIYFARIEHNSATRTKKMVLLK